MIMVTSPRVKPSIAGILPKANGGPEHPMKRPVESSHQRDGLARKPYELDGGAIPSLPAAFAPWQVAHFASKPILPI